MRIRKLRRPSAENVLHTDSPDNYTGPSAANRALFINLGIMKYGTDDKLQGAAIFLAMVLLFVIFVVFFVGLKDPEWSNEVLGWLGTPFLLVVGVAIGRGGVGRELGE